MSSVQTHMRGFHHNLRRQPPPALVMTCYYIGI